MQATKIKTSIMTANGLIEYTTEFLVKGKAYVTDLGEWGTIEVEYNSENGVWWIIETGKGQVKNRLEDSKYEALLRAAGRAMHLAMCVD